MAFNAAHGAVGSGGTLDAAAFATAAARRFSVFSLPSTLDIIATVPAFDTGINAYGTALTAISQMVANGSLLSDVLANNDPNTLAAAYATAAASPPAGGGGAAVAAGAAPARPAPAARSPWAASRPSAQPPA